MTPKFMPGERVQVFPECWPKHVPWSIINGAHGTVADYPPLEDYPHAVWVRFDEPYRHRVQKGAGYWQDDYTLNVAPNYLRQEPVPVQLLEVTIP